VIALNLHFAVAVQSLQKQPTFLTRPPTTDSISDLPPPPLAVPTPLEFQCCISKPFSGIIWY